MYSRRRRKIMKRKKEIKEQRTERRWNRREREKEGIRTNWKGSLPMSIEWSSFVFFFILKLKGNACAHLSWMVYVLCSVWCFLLHIISEFMQVLYCIELNWIGRWTYEKKNKRNKKNMNKTISYSSKPRTFAWNAENVCLCVRCVNQNDDRVGEQER